MFVTTSNTLNIPPALLDRMEIIRIAGYTEEEKLEIAKRHLVPKSMEHHGLQAKEFEVTEEALYEVIRRYTREAGVRNLEREMNSLCPQGGEGTHDDQVQEEDQGDARSREPVSRRAEVSLWRGRARGSGRRRHRPCLDGSRRRDPDDRSPHDARQGQDDGDRQPARRDEGVDLGCFLLRPLAGGHHRRQAAGVRQARHPRARAGRCDAQGWPVRRHRHGDGHRLGDDGHSRSAGTWR